MLRGLACAVIAACGSHDAAGSPATKLVKVRELGDSTWRFAAGQAVAWSPDDSRIAIGGWSHIVSVIDAATGAHAWDVELGVHDVIDGLAWSPDGKHLAAGTRGNAIAIFAAATGKLEHGIPGAGEVRALTYSATGDQLIATRVSSVHAWNVADGSPAGDFTGDCSSIEVGAASRDRSVFVVGAERGGVCAYSIAKRARIAEYPDAHHYNAVSAVSVSDDGASYATAGNDDWFQIWLAGKLVPGGGHVLHRATAIALVGDKVVTSIDHTIGVGPAATAGNPVTALADIVGATMIVPASDGKRLAIRTQAALQIVGIDGKLVAGPGAGHTAQVVAVGELPDGHVASIGRDDRLIVWDRTSPLRTLGSPGDKVWDGAIATRAAIAVTVSGLDPIRVYDLAAGKLVTSIELPRYESANTVAISPDGGTIASVTHDHVLRLWNARTGAELVAIASAGTESFNNRLAFSPDGASLVVAAGGSIGVIDVATRKTRRSFPGPHEAHAIAVAADGRIAVSDSDRSVAVYAADGTKLREWAAADYWVTGVAFAGADLVTSSLDDSTALWRTTDGHELARVRDHRATVETVAVSLDGKRAITGGSDGRVIVYELR
jgi:WD40 repeat protein